MDLVPIDVVKGMLARGETYSQMSTYLKQQYPQISRGFSEQSIRRFVKENGLKEEVKTDVAETVKQSVSKVTEIILIRYPV